MTERTAIAYDVTDGVATLRLDRPERRNAIDDAMRGEMIAALENAASDPAVRALVVTGTGSAFCAGGDVRGMRNRLAAPQEDVAFNGWRRQQRTHRAVALLHTMPKPTIAAVNGAAAGLGCDVALSCDFIMAAESAQFTMSFIARSLIPDGGGMYFLPRR
ncbi:MAG: enoyl-CoA hydratase/isomerase family protein, partial [Roseomonas sp.]|nr:enoyl-CoA hydratase/isomerase family protein [Roseomonas sp.]